jgi:transposase
LSIATLTTEITERLCPLEAAVIILCSITGVSRTRAEVMIAEMGTDMTRFPTAGHLCAWAWVAPASHESAGKRRPVGTMKGPCRTPAGAWTAVPFGPWIAGRIQPIVATPR